VRCALDLQAQAGDVNSKLEIYRRCLVSRQRLPLVARLVARWEAPMGNWRDFIWGVVFIASVGAGVGLLIIAMLAPNWL